MHSNNSSGRLNQTVARSIRAEMARNRVSQRELAVRLGVNQSFVWKRLNNHQPITVDFIDAAAVVLGVPFVRFFDEVEITAVAA